MFKKFWRWINYCDCHCDGGKDWFTFQTMPVHRIVNVIDVNGHKRTARANRHQVFSRPYRACFAVDGKPSSKDYPLTIKAIAWQPLAGERVSDGKRI